jgi:hypothetical protein
MESELRLTQLKYSNLITELHKFLELDILNRIIAHAEDGAETDLEYELKSADLQDKKQ